MKIRSIIIDDEEGSRTALKAALERFFPEIEIISVCNGALEGLDSIRNQNPQVVFLDIHMPKMSGFELLQQLVPFDFEVIFVTAHDEYAIKAIRFSALDYLLKPLDVEDLRAALERVKLRLAQKDTVYRYSSVLYNTRPEKIDRIAVPSTEGVDFYNTDDIIYCKAEGSYTKIILKEEAFKIVSRKLKDFEDLLYESGFCRVHHSFLINMKHVIKYIKGEGGYVTLSEGHQVDISRRKREEFLMALHSV